MGGALAGMELTSLPAACAPSAVGSEREQSWGMVVATVLAAGSSLVVNERVK